MANPQSYCPVLLEQDSPVAFTRIGVQDLQQHEEWLQKRLFKLPSLLPAENIHIDFGGPIPVARETPTIAGNIDLIFISPSGCLTIVETKLRQNADIRRKVVGQLIDYGSAIAQLSYADLLICIKRAKEVDARSPDPLVSAARNATSGPFDEERFKQSVSENLRRGRFLLLIVVDEVNETVERMTDFFTAQPQQGFLLDFTLALLEIAIFRGSGKEKETLLLQPRLAAKTREITRAVVEVRSIDGSHAIEIATPPEPPIVPRPPGVFDPQFFWGQLSKTVGSDLAGSARAMIEEAESVGLTVDWRANGPILKWKDPRTGTPFNFGQIAPDGTLASSSWLSCRAVRSGLPSDVWRGYYDMLVRLIPGSRLQEAREKDESESYVFIVGPDGNDPSIKTLLQNRTKWAESILGVIERVQTTPEIRPDELA